jgi:hypothetical protein
LISPIAGVIRRLRALEATKPEEPIPDFLMAPNGWRERLSEHAGAAADLIEEVRA